MKRFLGQSLSSSRWRLTVLAAVAVALLGAGIAFGAYFASGDALMVLQCIVGRNNIVCPAS